MHGLESELMVRFWDKGGLGLLNIHNSCERMIQVELHGKGRWEFVRTIVYYSLQLLFRQVYILIRFPSLTKLISETPEFSPSSIPALTSRAKPQAENKHPLALLLPLLF
jgi:hypothetical protein